MRNEGLTLAESLLAGLTVLCVLFCALIQIGFASGTAFLFSWGASGVVVPAMAWVLLTGQNTSASLEHDFCLAKAGDHQRWGSR